MADAEVEKKPPLHKILLLAIATQARRYQATKNRSQRVTILYRLLDAAYYLAGGHVPENDAAATADEVERLANEVFAAAQAGDDLSHAKRVFPIVVEAIRNGTSFTAKSVEAA